MPMTHAPETGDADDKFTITKKHIKM